MDGPAAIAASFSNLQEVALHGLLLGTRLYTARTVHFDCHMNLTVLHEKAADLGDEVKTKMEASLARGYSAISRRSFCGPTKICLCRTCPLRQSWSCLSHQVKTNSEALPCLLLCNCLGKLLV